MGVIDGIGADGAIGGSISDFRFIGMGVVGAVGAVIGLHAGHTTRVVFRIGDVIGAVR